MRRRSRVPRRAAGPSARPAGTNVPAIVAPATAAAGDERLARLIDTANLAAIVPRLAPEVLYAIIRHRGLDACGELALSATPEQLTAVFDIDLWRRPATGRDDQFDADRFGEWLETLVESGEAAAARTVAAIDEHLVVAGLSRFVRVLDPASLSPATAEDDASEMPAPFNGLARDVGGYLVRARTTTAWDAIVALLLELQEAHPRYFHAVMAGCRRLTDSPPERDGLNDLLKQPEQLMYDVAAERERRRSAQGYATPADARAFLQMAKSPPHLRAGGLVNPLAAAYFRAAVDGAASIDRSDGSQQHVRETPSESDLECVAAIAALVGGTGGLWKLRALPGRAAEPSRLGHVQPLLECVHHTDEAAFAARTGELAFLANVLMAGCSVQSRPFTPQEASDAAVATCNLGIEHWPARWPGARMQDAPSIAGRRASVPESFLVDHDLVTAFEVGWAVLHELSDAVAKHLVAALRDLRCADPQIQQDLHALRRELARQRKAGTPWRARGALEVIAILDMPTWVSLSGLLDECPILPAALTATLERRTGAVSAAAFEFIATSEQIAEIDAFAGRLVEFLVGA